MYGITSTGYQQGEMKVEKKLLVVGCLLLHTQMVTGPTESRAPINYDITRSEKNNKRPNMNHFAENKLEQGSDLGLLLGCKNPKEVLDPSSSARLPAW